MFDLDFDEEDLNEHQSSCDMNADVIREKIPTFSSNKLCDIIVCSKYIGFGDEFAVECMDELAKRRQNGDSFNYEDYIDLKLKELPQINLTIPNLQHLLNKFII
jgi:hypothetical protein